jgi:NAD(P)-dependent dehydrogenase (short-subunit alcohol dehydrogenase family)
MKQLADKVIAVIGSAGGIGRATCRDFAAAGANLALIDLNGPGNASVESDVQTTGAKAMTLDVDILDFASADRVVEDIVAEFGRIDGLCFLAGWTKLEPSLDVSTTDFQRALDINLTAQFVWSQAAARKMIPAGGGTIVLIASILAFGGIPRRAAYTASRGGLVQLVRTLAVEWAPRGIRVNAVAPGWVETDTVRDLGLPLTEYRARVPMKRLGRPEDVAGAMRFLSSHDSEWITGVTLPVDGGILAYVGPGDPALA